ncbi:MAG TPA: thiamine pyrophosphate-dependent dehydrogenase E1 component subunit alpha [Anaerolineaceae bacterium]|nr:thiamine pyrophosphate-dependent dehydrogenase E1 component subunit alpha [Anaerolineaceae bacterium]
MELSSELKKEMYWMMLLSRRLDERAWVLHRQGKIAFHISGIGQEAAQVGAAFAIKKGEDWVTPYYRDLALLVSLGLTPEEFMLSLMGKAGEPSSGSRQMPSHFGLRRVNVVSHSAPVATQAVHAAGIGLAMKIKKEKKVVITTIGEGSTSQGEWYEAVNWAAIHKLPVIFIVENNQYAISVPPEMQMAVKNAAEKACGLGLPGQTFDGNDMFGFYKLISELADSARNGNGPALVEAQMYRITPHSSDDDDRTYRSREEVDENKKHDPLILTQNKLLEQEVYTEKDLEDLDKKAKQMVTDAVKFAEEAPYPSAEEAAYPVYVEEMPNA